MRAGRNRWRVTIDEPGDAAVSSVGAVTTPWTLVGSYWAHKQEKSAKEGLMQGVETAITVTLFKLRNAPSLRLTPDMRLTQGTHVYNIREVLTSGPGESEVTLACIEVLS